MNFEIAEPLSVESILKLAPAVDSEMTSLAVERRDEVAQYQIWGALNYSPTTKRFNEIPGVIPELIYTRPDVLTISSRQPGSLLVSRANNLIGRFVGGEFIRATPRPFAAGAWAVFSSEPFTHIHYTIGVETNTGLSIETLLIIFYRKLLLVAMVQR